MNTYVALLRGINVGGNNKILMKDLRDLFIKLKFADVSTYIQSGNVLFKTRTDNKDDIALKVEKGIKKVFDLDISVIVKRQSDIESVLRDNPFFNENVDTKKLYVVFLNKKPSSTQKLSEFDFGTDEYVIKDDILYVKYDIGAGKTKLSVKIIEKKLDVIATARNWRTTNKVLGLVKL